jgi:hypothetical protein
MRIMTTMRKILLGIAIAAIAITAGISSLLTPRLAAQFREGEIPTPTPTELHCPYGNAEDSCTADYQGNGVWVLRKGETQ